MQSQPKGEMADRPISSLVVDVIAREGGIDPLELDQPLYDSIDTDALDALFRDGGIDGAVEFTYLGYSVSVADEGNITVERRRS